MNRHPEENQHLGFLLGLVTGAAVGGGLAMYFAPKIGSKIRKRVSASAKDLGDTASGYYDQVSTRVVDTVGELAQRTRDAAAGVVVRGAHEVARGAHEVERLAVHVAKAAGTH